MISRFILMFLTIVLASVSVFALDVASVLLSPIFSLFGKDGIYSLLSNPVVVFSLIYLAYLLGFFNILKIALRPVFGADHLKETNTVARMLSFIGVTGMFYLFSKEDGIDGAILLFGGSVGFILLSIVGASVIYIANEK